MAVIWQKKRQGKHYEVRTAGSTRRLYTNGVCHSQYNPRKVLTGSIWDLLFIPALFHQRRNQLRVLVLGVGAGVIIRLLNEFLSIEEIHGVELDPTHLYIAKRFFELDEANVTLYQAEAAEWVETYSGERFDIVIEDLFTEKLKQPIRALSANSAWYKKLIGLLAKDGVLIMNFASQVESQQSAARQIKLINHSFKSMFQLTMPTLDNCVAAYLQHNTDSVALHKELQTNDVLRAAIDTKYLRYRIRKQRRL